MVTLLLPTPISRSRLRGFWTALCLLGTAVLTASSRALTIELRFGLWTALALAFAIGLARPYALQMLYRAWNQVVRRFLEVATVYLSAVCLHTVLRAERRVDAPRRFEPRPATPTTWHDRGTQPVEQYASLHHAPEFSTSGTWTDRFRAWSAASGRSTATALLPFLVLLRWLDPDPDGASSRVPTNIYTLY